MSERTNEEKLRILQDRLATIQNKNEIEQQIKTEQNKPVAPVFKEELVNQPTSKPIKIQDTKERTFNFKYFIIFFIITLVGYGGFEVYNTFDFAELFSSEEEQKDEKETEIIYNKSYFDGKNVIIILNSFTDQNIANAEAQDLSSKGYQCSVLQLSGVSNSTEEIFQTYIGPFNKAEEAKQYLNSTEFVSENGILIELQ
jgi:hypothetical protein